MLIMSLDSLYVRKYLIPTDHLRRIRIHGREKNDQEECKKLDKESETLIERVILRRLFYYKEERKISLQKNKKERKAKCYRVNFTNIPLFDIVSYDSLTFTCNTFP